jgi:hypothetical protein
MITIIRSGTVRKYFSIEEKGPSSHFTIQQKLQNYEKVVFLIDHPHNTCFMRQ